MSTPRTDLSNKSTQIENTSEIDICRYNLSVSVLSGQGESLASVTPYQQRITRNNKRKETPYTSVIRKEPIRDTVNPRKISKEGTVTDVEKYSYYKTLPFFRHKVDYEGDTDEKKRCSDDSRTETDDCVRNLDKEHENEDNEESKEDNSVTNITNE